jgi:hypothetical protein
MSAEEEHTMSETQKTLEQRIDALERERYGLPDTSGWSQEKIAHARQVGILPAGTADPNPMAKAMDYMAQVQQARSAPPMTPAQSLEHYGTEGAFLCHIPQNLILNSPTDQRRTNFQRGWHIVPADFYPLLNSGYCGCECAPAQLVEQLWDMQVLNAQHVGVVAEIVVEN